jgi:C1A family cysteine protease
MLKSIALATLAAFGTASADFAVAGPEPHSELDYQLQFAEWMQEYNKQYDTMEMFYRFGIFKQNLLKIEAHNAGDHSYTLGVNQFMDMSDSEFKKVHLSGIAQNGFYRTAEGKTACTPASFKAPTAKTVDWTAKGMVSGVKNQQQCGSCWAFSTTGSIEAHAAIKSGKAPVPLSEQQLVDCSSSYGNQGCNGGLMDNAFEFLADNGGSCTEAAYPYTAAQGQCQTSCQKVQTVSGCMDIQVGDVDMLKGAIEQAGPVSIAIEADQLAFQFYHGGVLTGRCGTKLDHGVLLVGYDDTYTTPYWKVKNSWGESWGEQGYLRIEQAGDKCGVTQAASIPVV